MRNLLSILLFYSLSFSQYSYTVTLNCSAFSPNVCERGNGFSGAVSTVNFSYNSNSAKITCKATNVVKDDMVSFPPGFTVSQVPVPSGSCDLDYTRNGVSEPRHSNVAGNSCTAGSSESFWADRCWSAASLGSVTISLVGSSPLECPNPNPSIDASFCPRPVPEEHSGTVLPRRRELASLNPRTVPPARTAAALTAAPSSVTTTDTGAFPVIAMTGAKKMGNIFLI